MAQLTVTVPDALVGRVVAALQSRYPDLDGTAAQIGKAGIRRLLGETLAAAEERSGHQAMAAAVEVIRLQAIADADAIT